MRRLRVLACAFTCCPPGKPGFGGGEDLLGWNLLKQIARFHDVWALTYPKNRSSIEEALREESIASIQVCYVDLPSWLRPLLRFQGTHQFYYHLWQLKAYLIARRLHQLHAFDLFHQITYANDWLASFIGAFLPVPYVRGPGGGAHRTPKGFEGEYPLGGRLWERVRSLGQWLFRHDPIFVRGQRRADAILVCNRESFSNIPAKWSHKAHLFPVSGISSQDLALASPAQTQDSRFSVLSAGALIRVKGFGLAIKAFKEFADRHPESEFSIIGTGPEEARLRALARRLRLLNRVHFLSWLPREELLARMASHDVFLFPSLRDGGGTVVIEAMAIGRPVVCLDTGGPGMHVTEQCGVKVSPVSPQQAVRDLAGALERLYLDKGLRLRLGKAARERAEQAYHWDRLGERLMEIYRRALPHEPGV
jgi:glycosyltransferase involved in cell wall biosynthesis